MSTSFRCLVSTVESDSHIWNLVYLQKLLEENGAAVRNLGSCTPVDLVVRGISEYRPDLLVVSSVNGHGHHGARVLLSALHDHGIEMPCVVGGKLTTAESDNDRVRRDLLAHGYTDVFVGEDAITRFRAFLNFGVSEGFSEWQAEAAVVPPWDATEVAGAGVRSCI
ncbi:methylmalonyl-CoA mutase [Streptomyces sp. MUSC 14]|uniref:cobalamin B12-binding domain-containing protein n=1 Tax=Streptomyces sp. MUSC 14 TaxID=1354889 RepID=UPI0008F59ADA|nr:cobalamin-dependent protein [Streptomyces sp. MUSC 14]OIJ94403.1 methylmalonyl-CoA mutase [Streptomyces sp. MUSC 14]